MQHTLNTDVVEMTGSVIAGILFNHIDFYIEKVWGDEGRLHDGDYWTYSSNKSLEKSHPYLTPWQVRAGIEKLVSCGLLKTGNFNKNNYDRTVWYALSEKGKSICYFSQIHLMKTTNGDDENRKPIPDKSSTDKSSTDKSSTDISSCAKRSLSPVEHDSNEWKLANFILESVRHNFPDVHAKDSDTDKWASEIEKIHRIDGYAWQTICDVLEFALNDPFWQRNIRSGGKFREKFEDLLVRKTSHDKRNLRE